jgi:hypothetical protein
MSFALKVAHKGKVALICKAGLEEANNKEIEFFNHDNMLYGCKATKNLYSLYLLLLFLLFFS